MVCYIIAHHYRHEKYDHNSTWQYLSGWKIYQTHFERLLHNPTTSTSFPFLLLRHAAPIDLKNHQIPKAYTIQQTESSTLRRWFWWKRNPISPFLKQWRHSPMCSLTLPTFYRLKQRPLSPPPNTSYTPTPIADNPFPFYVLNFIGMLVPSLDSFSFLLFSLSLWVCLVNIGFVEMGWEFWSEIQLGFFSFWVFEQWKICWGVVAGWFFCYFCVEWRLVKFLLNISFIYCV